MKLFTHDVTAHRCGTDRSAELEDRGPRKLSLFTRKVLGRRCRRGTPGPKPAPSDHGTAVAVTGCLPPFWACPRRRRLGCLAGYATS